MLHVVLAEAEVELIPRELWNHRAILAYAKRRGKAPGKCLLDSSLHHAAMRALPEHERRGRPDIVHLTLLCLLGSILNKEGLLRVYVHTRNDEVIYIKPETRLPRNYNRFVGLVEKLFEVEEDILLRMRKLGIEELIKEINPSHTIIMDEGGAPVTPSEFAEKLQENTCIIIGAFPHGGFRKSYAFVDERLCIYEQPLDAWTIANEVTCLYEYSLLRK
jgi:rRNA small subunit pseudouridine methyltransferase Nep1